MQLQTDSVGHADMKSCREHAVTSMLEDQRGRLQEDEEEVSICVSSGDGKLLLKSSLGEPPKQGW